MNAAGRVAISNLKMVRQLQRQAKMRRKLRRLVLEGVNDTQFLTATF